LKVSSERIEGCQVALTVEAEPEEMEKALDGAYRRLVNKVAVPGFRKGKAPRALLERHVGKDYLESEALDQLVPELYQQAIEQEDIDIIGHPDMEMVQTDPPIFKATIPVQPVVELGDYHSIRVTPETIKITEENIDEGIENLRKMQTTLEPVEREVQFDDVANIDITATVDDKTVLDREGDSIKLTEDSDVPTPGFAKQIIGMKAGDEKEFTLPFPEDHANEELAGKDCRFKVSISDIKIEVLPELGDEFAKSLGQEIETMDQLREKLAENMRAAAERDVRNKVETEVLEAIANQSKVEFPAILTEHEIDRMANEQMMRFGGMQVEDFLRYRGITEEDFRNELRPTAENRVRNSLVLNKVHEIESIEITDDEISAEIDRVIEEAGEQGEQVRAMFNAPEARDSIRGRLLTEKTLNNLIEMATSGEAEPTPAEASEEEPQTDEPDQQSANEEETTHDEA